MAISTICHERRDHVPPTQMRLKSLSLRLLPQKIKNMIRKHYLSRRQLVMALTVPPIAAHGSPTITSSLADADLINLGRQFDEAAAQIDYAISHAKVIQDGVLERFSRIEAEILSWQSKIVEGRRVKAQAACWALLGDLDPSDQSTTDTRMVLSIVRDLIRLYDSHLENPGALKKLAAGVEK
jgi:hypothetical protein